MPLHLPPPDPFIWDGKTYQGTHEPLITVQRFEDVTSCVRRPQ
jgi:hypothetical protein